MRRLPLWDYHLAGPRIHRDELAGHLHGWLYRISHSERRPTDPDQHLAPFGAWVTHRDRHGFVVRVCWYDEDHAHHALRTLAREQTAVLGGQVYQLARVVPLTREPVTPDMLMDGSGDVGDMEVRAVEPVVLRKSGRFHLSLAPADILGACEERWERLWPGFLPYSVGDLQQLRAGAPDRWGRIPVTRLEVRTVVRRVDGVAAPGLLGEVRYGLGRLRHAEERRLAVALLRLGELAGVGGRTAYGYGRVSAVHQQMRRNVP